MDQAEFDMQELVLEGMKQAQALVTQVVLIQEKVLETASNSSLYGLTPEQEAEALNTLNTQQLALFQILLPMAQAFIAQYSGLIK